MTTEQAAMNPHAQRCTARSKRSGQRCNNIAVKGFTVCRIHGGKSLVGVDNPNFKTGRYSKHVDLPEGLAQIYHDALNDPDALSSMDEIALVQARIIELLELADVGVSGEAWEAAKTNAKLFEQARVQRNADLMAHAWKELTEAIDTGLANHELWSELARFIELRQKLTASETKRRLAMGQLISVKQALALMGAVVGILQKHIDNPAVLQTIGTEINALIEGRVEEFVPLVQSEN